MKAGLAVATLVATASLSNALFAQGIDEFGAYGGRRSGPGSKQVGALEIRIGRYVPQVDNDFGGTGPYETTFGTKNRYSFGLEVDWQALRIPYFGTLGPGFGIEYTKMSGRSFNADDRTQRVSEESSLAILPLYAVAVLRMDYLARETPIPIVPYGKLGIGSALWWTSDGAGTANADGVVGRGLSYGPQFALGGMFLLDVLDRSSASYMDDSVGVNNSYLFAEWYYSQLDGFGSGKQMNVGTNTWVVGLAVEF